MSKDKQEGRICPKCGRRYTEPPALSRADNATEICPLCGTLEALASIPRRRAGGVTAMAKAYRGRYCTRFYCDKVGERRCCADCWRRERHKCRNACQNDPGRCGLQNKAAAARARGGVRHG